SRADSSWSIATMRAARSGWAPVSWRMDNGCSSQTGADAIGVRYRATCRYLPRVAVDGGTVGPRAVTGGAWHGRRAAAILVVLPRARTKPAAARERSNPGVPPLTVTEVTVVGAGAAGLYTAVCAAREGAQVTLVSATPLAESSSWWAQGGLAAAVS